MIKWLQVYWPEVEQGFFPRFSLSSHFLSVYFFRHVSDHSSISFWLLSDTSVPTNYSGTYAFKSYAAL